MPPIVQVSARDAALAAGLKRETISTVLGGSHKMMFPYPRIRAEGPTYCCLKESENNLLPESPGKHGIIVVKALPDSLVIYLIVMALILAAKWICVVYESHEVYGLDLSWNLQRFAFI